MNIIAILISPIFWGFINGALGAKEFKKDNPGLAQSLTWLSFVIFCATTCLVYFIYSVHFGWLFYSLPAMLFSIYLGVQINPLNKLEKE